MKPWPIRAGDRCKGARVIKKPELDTNTPDGAKSAKEKLGIKEKK